MLKISYVDDGGAPEIVFEGVITASQVQYAFDAVVTAPEFKRGIGLVADATGQVTDYSHDEVEQLAAHVAAKKEYLGSRLALVISPGNDLQFGLARMFSTYAGIHDLTVGIFTTAEEAFSWAATSSEG